MISNDARVGGDIGGRQSPGPAAPNRPRRYAKGDVRFTTCTNELEFLEGARWRRMRGPRDVSC